MDVKSQKCNTFHGIFWIANTFNQTLSVAASDLQQWRGVILAHFSVQNCFSSCIFGMCCLKWPFRITAQRYWAHFLWKCACIYIYIYIYIYTYTYTYTYIHIHIYIYIYIYIHTYVYIHTYIHTYIHIYIHTYIHIYTYIDTHTHTHYVFLLKHVRSISRHVKLILFFDHVEVFF